MNQSQSRIDLKKVWTVIRAVLVVWSVAVWVLLIMLPVFDKVKDINTAIIHIPHVFIGLGLIGAIFAAYSLKSDMHLLWFIGVLLLLAGWI